MITDGATRQRVIGVVPGRRSRRAASACSSGCLVAPHSGAPTAAQLDRTLGETRLWRGKPVLRHHSGNTPLWAASMSSVDDKQGGTDSSVRFVCSASRPKIKNALAQNVGVRIALTSDHRAKAAVCRNRPDGEARR